MAAKESSEGAKIVRASERDPLEWYSAEDREYFMATVDAWLRNHFGYDYHDWKQPGEHRAAA
jgi:hypothetical protein